LDFETDFGNGEFHHEGRSPKRLQVPFLVAIVKMQRGVYQ